MPKKEDNPFKMGYDPKLDKIPELDSDALSYHLNVAGIIRWMIELGRNDFITEVSLLLSNVAFSREVPQETKCSEEDRACKVINHTSSLSSNNTASRLMMEIYFSSCINASNYTTSD